MRPGTPNTKRRGRVARREDGVTVWGSSVQDYVHTRRALFSLPPQKIRVVQMETGRFGGKEKNPSITRGSALLAKSGKSSQDRYDRRERHRSRPRTPPGENAPPDGVRGTAGSSRGYRLVIDGGGTCTVASRASRGTSTRLGRLLSRRVRAAPSRTAFRARRLPRLGAAAEHLSTERHWTAARPGRLAQAELRRKFHSDGQTSAAGGDAEPIDRQASGEGPALSDYPPARTLRARTRGPVKQAWVSVKAAPASPDRRDLSLDRHRGSDDRRRVRADIVHEIGQGTTRFSLRLPPMRRMMWSPRYVQRTPRRSQRGPTVASRKCMMWEAGRGAAVGLRATPEAPHGGIVDFASACRDYIQRVGPLRARRSIIRRPARVE